MPDSYVFSKPHIDVGGPFATTEPHFFDSSITHTQVLRYCDGFTAPCQCPDCAAIMATGVIRQPAAPGLSPPPPPQQPYGHNLPVLTPLHFGIARKGKGNNRRYGIRVETLPR